MRDIQTSLIQRFTPLFFFFLGGSGKVLWWLFSYFPL
ncbi:hypothetical protein BPO_1333 [Bergeyella porcorum]|uniref:Uncharacterized protein n=1 Tax=Bergeyella porcorum TaxID=1735111 RepID=A0AAU0F0Y6_9FLAO